VLQWYADALSLLADRAPESSSGSLCVSSYSDIERDCGLKSVQRAAATLDRVTPHSTTRDPAMPLSLELLMTFRIEPEDPREAACTRLRACTDTDKDTETDTDRVARIY
jgi:hypothetical protein